MDAKQIASNIKWIGRLDHAEYIKWLKSSWCHVYLTHPFVPSWSLAEAICCDCNIICSDVRATREYLVKPNDLKFVNHRNPEEISEKIIETLKGATKIPKIRRPCIERLSTDSTCHSWATVAGLDLATQG